MNAGRGKVQIPSRNQYNWTGVSTWKDGKGIFLKYPTIKEGDIVKLLIFGPGGAEVNLEAYTTNEGLRNITLYTPMRDSLARGESRVYLLNLSDYSAYIKTYSINMKITKYFCFPRVQLSNNP
jgi:hypothetical protein